MIVLRRDFLKYCIGSAAALGLEFPNLGILGRKVFAGPPAPSYPISTDIYTTLDRTLVPITPPPLHGGVTLLPCQISEYAIAGYGKWVKDKEGFPDGPGFDFVRPDMQNPPNIVPSIIDPSAVTLLSFFAMSDIHICDKESPARAIYYGYQFPWPYTTKDKPPQPQGNSSAYSGIMLYTTQVHDAAVQTINALHKKTPFDFGMSLGDAADNTQYNEIRWFIDVFDGKIITPSSGAHLGAGTIDYQKPYRAAGLDTTIPWYQVVGNHDQFWMGSALPNSYIQETLIGSGILNMGQIPAVHPGVNWPAVMSSRGYYMGVVDGLTKYGDIIGAGAVQLYKTPPRIAADSNRYSLSISDWMEEFLNTTSLPVGHGFTQQMIEDSFACYHFYPRVDMPIKVIVLDDTDKTGSAYGAIDGERYKWLINELEEGQRADESS
jgi:metallophosphoesterase (TIGR03768 family)